MPNYFYTHVTSDLSLDSSHQYLSVDATAGSVTLSLESTAFRGGRFYIISRSDGSGNTVTIVPNGTDTIDGAATLAVTSADIFTIIADSVNGNWVVSSSA
jgi:hypothetical protein